MKKWLAWLRRKVARWIKQPRQTQLAFVEAFLWLGLSRGGVLLFPFRFIAPYLGRLNHETSTRCSQPEEAVAQDIAWVISVSSRYTPWRSNCLAQAIAGKMMLRRRQVASTLYLGLKTSTNQLEAHAWLRVGEQIVTGGVSQFQSQFKVVSFFGASSI